jgi:hypothetical protein
VNYPGEDDARRSYRRLRTWPRCCSHRPAARPPVARSSQLRPSRKVHRHRFRDRVSDAGCLGGGVRNRQGDRRLTPRGVFILPTTTLSVRWTLENAAMPARSSTPVGFPEPAYQVRVPKLSVGQAVTVPHGESGGHVIHIPANSVAHEIVLPPGHPGASIKAVANPGVPHTQGPRNVGSYPAASPPRRAPVSKGPRSVGSYTPR